MHIKLVQFTLLVHVSGRLREFNFRQRNSEQYDVNTADERGERYYFKLIKESNTWQFHEQLLPTWLRNSEQVIIEAFLKRGFEG